MRLYNIFYNINIFYIMEAILKQIRKKLNEIATETEELFEGIANADEKTLEYLVHYYNTMCDISEKLDETRNAVVNSIPVSNKIRNENEEYLKRMEMIRKVSPFLLCAVNNNL